MTGLLFGVFILLLLLGVPIAFSVALAGIAVLVDGNVSLMMIAQKMFASTNSFPLIAVPFFILAGDLLSQGSISRLLVEFIEAILGRIRGSLSAVSVVAGMFFAAISGSGAATTAAVGGTLVNPLKERGYEPASSAALIAAAGCIGVVIPPSVPMVLYAVIADQSVVQLFRNGFLPGVMMGVILIAISMFQAYKRHYPQGEPFSIKRVAKCFVKSIWGILMPVIILVGIFSGYFTPSEAAAVAVIYGALVSMFVYRDLTFKNLCKIIMGSAKTSAIIMIIIACSGIFGYVLANWQIPQQVAAGVLAISDNKYVILLLIAIIILIAGVFMETSSAVILLTPVFLPLVTALGVNLVHFGIVFVGGISIGMITPPVAINLFVASSITELSLETISKKVIPYLLGLIAVYLLYLYIPLFIPGIIT